MDRAGDRSTRSADGSSLGDGPLLDAPVSRTEYRLGPGDRLGIAVVGEFSEVYTAVVTPEGSVLLPGLGIARVLGLNLDDAEDRVRAVVERLYRNVTVRLALTRVRTFKVFLVGDVPSPGTREASAATRVSEVIGNDEEGRTPRNVIVRRTSGEVLSVDLLRFLRSGDTRMNPFLRDGDAVTVPTSDQQITAIGRFHYPGTYEFRSGETLADFMEIVNGGGGFPSNAADTLRVVRTEGGARRTHYFTRSQASGPEGRQFALNPFDAIYLAELNHFYQNAAVRVVGEVRRPGMYPIRRDTTTVRDLVLMAGGLTSDAAPEETHLQRAGITAARTDSLEVPVELLTPEERRVRQASTVGNAASVVADFGRILGAGGERYDIPLRPGDVLTVPSRRGDITVRGAVRTPGLVSYRPGLTLAQYITQAGWYTRRADHKNVVVMRGGSGARLSAAEAGTLRPGDIVIVPFREPLRWTEVLSTSQVLITAVTSVVLTAVAIFR